MNKMIPEVDEFIDSSKMWGEEFEKLRAISLASGLTEELKWGKPCYTFQKSNIVIIQGFKEFCALMFFKGALLDDPEAILKKPGPNSRAARRIEFSNVQQIAMIERILEEYIHEAIEVEKAGLKVESEEKAKIEVPEEFNKKLDEDSAFKRAFESLTPGRQRAYLRYFSQAKQSKTRESRVERFTQKILDGKGLNDR